MRFVDTNVLLYSISQDPAESRKACVEVLGAALDTSHRFRIAYWDAAILEAARALGCSVILSEDLDHGNDYDGVRVEDPFRRAT